MTVRLASKRQTARLVAGSAPTMSPSSQTARAANAMATLDFRHVISGSLASRSELNSYVVEAAVLHYRRDMQDSGEDVCRLQDA
jgi:hypothetical protein